MHISKFCQQIMTSYHGNSLRITRGQLYGALLNLLLARTRSWTNNRVKCPVANHALQPTTLYIETLVTGIVNVKNTICYSSPPGFTRRAGRPNNDGWVFSNSNCDAEGKLVVGLPASQYLVPAKFKIPAIIFSTTNGGCNWQRHTFLSAYFDTMINNLQVAQVFTPWSFILTEKDTLVWQAVTSLFINGGRHLQIDLVAHAQTRPRSSTSTRYQLWPMTNSICQIPKTFKLRPIREKYDIRIDNSIER